MWLWLRGFSSGMSLQGMKILRAYQQESPNGLPGRQGVRADSYGHSSHSIQIIVPADKNSLTCLESNSCAGALKQLRLGFEGRLHVAF